MMVDPRDYRKGTPKGERTVERSLFLGLENVSSRMTRLGRNELCLNRIVPLSEVVERINAVSLDDVKTLAPGFIRAKHFTLSTIGPLKEPVNLQALL